MKRKMRIGIAVLAALIMLAACAFVLRYVVHGPIWLDRMHSRYDDFMEIDDMAYSRCVLTVVNESDEKAYVRISATASLFDRNHLYAQKALTGYTADMISDVFPLETGENILLVYFGAPYGGDYIRGSRNLPCNIRITEVAEDDPAIMAVAEERYFGGEILLSRADVETGNLSAMYDTDRDGTEEKLEFGILYPEDEPGVSKWGVLRISLYDEECLVSQWEHELGVGEDALMQVLLYDFGAADDSLELIVQYRSCISFYMEGQEFPSEEMWTSLVRIADGQLFSDFGSIYGSGGYRIEPAASYKGKLFSIVGNRVTLETGFIPPVRIDLADSIVSTD